MNGTLLDANTTNSDGNTPPIWVDGKFGKALQFDGVDDYVKVPRSESLENPYAFSVGMWVYYNGYSNDYANLIQKGVGGARYFQIYMTDTTITGRTRNSSQEISLSVSTSNPRGNWYHIFLVANGTHLKLFKNGEKIGEKGAVSPYDTRPTNDIIIGKYSETIGDVLNGTIDEVRIYNRALSEEEIKLLYLSRPDLNNIKFVYPTTTSCKKMITHQNFLLISKI
jgi:Sialidase, N-terminal domain.